MSKLACSPECPAIEVAIDHDAKTDATSNGHHQEMIIELTLTDEFLINRQAIDIIIKKDTDPQAVFQRSADLNILPVHYPRVNASTALRVDQAAHAKTHADNLFPGNAALTKQFLDALFYEV